VIAKEMLAATLLSIHNLHVMISLARDIRQSIMIGKFNDFLAHFHEQVSQKERS
jgi:tRNA-guanine family transglycosylase